MERKAVGFALTYCDKMAKEKELYAQERRPWQDRTGEARKKIIAIVLDGKEKSYDVFEVKTETVKDDDGKVRKDSNGNTAKTVESRKKGTAVIKGSEGKIGIALVHRVDYGAALEEANDGKYAILKPTLLRFKAEFERTANEYFGGKG
jgi:hypothetical protein